MAELCDTRARGNSPLQVSFDFRHSGLGSARVTRVGFGVSSKQSFREARDRETRSPARGTARATGSLHSRDELSLHGASLWQHVRTCRPTSLLKSKSPTLSVTKNTRNKRPRPWRNMAVNTLSAAARAKRWKAIGNQNAS